MLRALASKTARAEKAKSQDTLETEALIRRAALELFVEKGFHGTSARDIADRVGTSVSHLYYYFPSKSHVLTSMMILIMEDLFSELSNALEEAEDNPVARMSALVKRFVIFHSRRRAEAFVGRSELRSLTPEARPRVVALHDRVTALFNSTIADGMKAGVFDCPHKKEATNAIVAMCYGVANWYRKDGALSPETIANRYSQLALQMLGHRGA